MGDGKSVHKMAVQTTYENLLLSYSGGRRPWHFLFLLNQPAREYGTTLQAVSAYHNMIIVIEVHIFLKGTSWLKTPKYVQKEKVYLKHLSEIIELPKSEPERLNFLFFS